jgi:hypothetical protein
MLAAEAGDIVLGLLLKQKRGMLCVSDTSHQQQTLSTTRTQPRQCVFWQSLLICVRVGGTCCSPDRLALTASSCIGLQQQQQQQQQCNLEWRFVYHCQD